MSNLTQLYKSKEKKGVPWKQSFCLSNLLQPLLQYPSKPYCTFWAWAIWSTNVSSLSLQRSCLVCCMLYAFHISKCPLSMKRIDTGGWLKNHYKHTSKVPACHPSHLGIKTNSDPECQKIPGRPRASPAQKCPFLGIIRDDSPLAPTKDR